MSHPTDPAAAARAREALLAAYLLGAEAAAPSLAPEALRELEHSDAPALIPALLENQLEEEALEWLRRHRRDSPLRTALEPLARQAYARRSATLHREGDRVWARIRFSKTQAPAALGAPELQTLFLAALRLEGLRPALDLGQRPRPLLLVAPPLPPDVEGEAEWLEFQLAAAPADGAALLPRLKRRLPEGLGLLDWSEAPAFATPVHELCESAHWRWAGDAKLRPATEAFLASREFFLEKAGKVGGQKQAEKRVDLRPAVRRMVWEGDELRFETALGPFAALNPLKLLGAILGLEPASIQGLRRTGFSMAPDPRLAQADKFQTKLKNLYEDAVLLGSASNITIVDEDEDEPIQLG